MASAPLRAALVGLVAVAHALPGPLARTPPMGFNSWTAFGTGVNAADLQGIADYFVANGLAAAGYEYVNSDDGWSLEQRNATSGELVADPFKFPAGLAGVSSYLRSKGLKFGIYSAASSVVCSGRPGSLYNEMLDAKFFAEQGVSYVKYDNCGEYSLGSRRFDVMADAVAASGSAMVISTEPFAVIPNPLQSAFSHLFRTGDDISASWETIIDRIDRNAKWADFVAPGSWADPDMLQVGNGLLSLSEQRAHFGLWAIAKAPLIIGADVRKYSAAQLAIVTNKEVIAVNQDPLGAPARKLAINGTLTPRFVGLASCFEARLAGGARTGPGLNGVRPETLTWTPLPLGVVNGSDAFALFHNASGRCLATRTYMQPLVPVLVPCASPAEDLSQAWTWASGAGRIGGLANVAALVAAAAGANPTNATVLGVSNSTLYGAVHGKDDMPLLDQAYGIQQLSLVPYAPEPPCDSRNCQNYDPTQSWYWSPASGLLSLAHAPANFYRVWEGPGYVLTSHLPTWDEFCLSSVASISNDPIDPTTTSTGGQDVWGGPLSGGAFVFGLLNRDAAGSSNATITARWSMLEDASIGDGTSACVRDLWAGKQLGVFTGSVSVSVAPHDLAVLRVVPGASSC